MKYKTLKIAGHPRSGTHWINHLIDINFLSGDGYLQYYIGHLWGDTERALRYLQNPNQQAVIYIHRNVEDTIDSIYRMRHRFGLNEDNFEKFKTTPMREMFNPDIKVNAIVDNVKSKRCVSEVDTLFWLRKETVGEYINTHRESWMPHLNKPNFKIVSYDDMVDDFQKTMLDMSKFLGVNKTNFKDTDTRVGWREEADNTWIKPEKNNK